MLRLIRYLSSIQALHQYSTDPNDREMAYLHGVYWTITHFIINQIHIHISITNNNFKVDGNGCGFGK